MKDNSTKDKPLYVMQVLPALESGGVERGTIDISCALAKAGHASLCVSRGGRLVQELETHNARHIELAVHTKNPLAILLNGFRLARIIRHHRVSLMHVRSRAPAWSCLLARKLTGIPLVSTFHGQYGSQNKLKRYYNSGMLRADHCIAVSDFIAQHIRQTYPTLTMPLSTIYRGVDLDYFSSDAITPARLATVRNAWGLSEGRSAKHKIILLPGRMTRLKGHDIFLKALSQMQSRKFIAVIVGDDQNREHYVEELKQLAEQLQLRDRVIFTGACRDMAAAYALSDLVVSASTKPESFGRVGCEALAMQKQVVVTDHGGSAETIPDCQKQGLCQPGSVEDMARALEMQLTLNETEAKQIGQASREHIVQHYSLDLMCSKTISLYLAELAKHKAKQLKSPASLS